MKKICSTDSKIKKQNRNQSSEKNVDISRDENNFYRVKLFLC